MKKSIFYQFRMLYIFEKSKVHSQLQVNIKVYDGEI
jgi:hypothetical protein